MTAATAVPSPAPLTVVDDPIEQGRYTRWVTGAAGEELGESSLQLSGMVCAACAGIIERAIGAVEGVRSVQVSAAAQRATVCWDPERTRPSALIEAVRGAGYEAVPDAAAPARALRRREHRQALWRLFVASFCAMQVMMMATPSYVAGPGELAPDLWQLLAWGSWLLSLPVLAFSAGPYFSGAWRALRQRRIIDGLQMLNTIDSASFYGLIPDDYRNDILKQKILSVYDSTLQKINATTLYEINILLTDAYFNMAVHIRKRKLDADSLTPVWKGFGSDSLMHYH